jgi:flagellar hook-associated protein 3 FlgL
MRISTSMMYETATTQMGNLQSSINRTMQQINTNRRILTPSDDPVASARALVVSQAQSMNTQFETNRQNAKSSLSHVDLALGSVSSLIQDVQTLAVSAGNAGLNNGDRSSKATELEGRLTDLLALANTADGTGGYLFAGFKTDNPPYSQTATGATYNGDQGQRQLQVASGRQIDVSTAGSAVFDSGITGNGSFVTASNPGNDASVAISAGTVADASQLTGDSYAITFDATGSNYTVMNTTLNLPVPPLPDPATPIAYASGTPITVDGMKFEISGTPTAGNSFTVEKSQKESIFTTVTNLINLLRAPADDATSKAALSAGLATAQKNLASNFDNVLIARSAAGASLKEIDYLDSAGTDLDLQYTSTLSSLQDIDLVKAISLLSQQKLTLEAAQKSFTTMSGLSLFNYISG